MKKILIFLLSSFFMFFSNLQAADTIKLGILEDETGNFAIAVVPKIHAYELAVKEINANGGVLGKQLEIVRYDTQSDNRRFQEFARRLIKKDKVDVVFGAFSSASRESIRGIMEKNKMLYFYNNQYEGGVCSKTTFMTGAVPEQQFSTLVPWMMEKYGKNVYTIAADYNFGQISAEWVRQIVKEAGGTMVGEEFIPLDVSQYSQTIQKIQKAKPDVLMTLLVGAKQASFYEQQASAGLGIPMATSINVGQAYEHRRFAPPALENMYVTVNYIQEVHEVIKSGEFHDKWFLELKNNKFVDKITGKKINDETMRLLEMQKDSMIKFLLKIPKLYYAKSHFPLEISQRAFDHLWRVCESYEMWCKETKQEELITLQVLN